MKITLLVPTLNEIDGFKEVMPKIDKSWYDQLLVVDGGSTDGTADLARSMGYDVYAQKKRGLRNGYIEALPHIKGDVIITFSPDGNSVPELIPPLVEKMKEGHDMVIVSRYAAGAKSYDDDAVTAFGNWLFTSVINLLHRSKYTDTMVMFRAYKKNIVFDLDLDKESSYSMEEKLFGTKISWEPLMSVRAAKRKLKTAEIPGDEPKRIGGVRKLEVIRWGLAYMAQVFKEVFCWR